VFVGLQIFTPKDEDSFVENFIEIFHQRYLFYRSFIPFSVFAYTESGR